MGGGDGVASAPTSGRRRAVANVDRRLPAAIDVELGCRVEPAAYLTHVRLSEDQKRRRPCDLASAVDSHTSVAATGCSWSNTRTGP